MLIGSFLFFFSLIVSEKIVVLEFLRQRSRTLSHTNVAIVSLLHRSANYFASCR